MRIVLDTNVFISGIFWLGPPSVIMDLWESRKLKIVLSSDIFDEYSRVAHELQKKFPTVDLTGIFDLLIFNGEFCASKKLGNPVCADPDDDKFLACALESGVGIVVSGDKLLLAESGYRGIEVLSPSSFLRFYKG